MMVFTEGSAVRAARFRFIHWIVNQNARRQTDKAEHERLKQYYKQKLQGIDNVRGERR
jgi:hypothetical protein